MESLKAPPHEQKGDRFSPQGQHQHMYRDGISEMFHLLVIIHIQYVCIKYIEPGIMRGE